MEDPMKQFTKEDPLVIEMADTSRPKKNRPKGLRKPWDYITPIPDIKAMLDELRDAAKSLPFSGSSVSCYTHPTGVEIYLSLKCGNLDDREFEEFTIKIKSILWYYLGEDAQLLVRHGKWLWFNTHIYYKEYVAIRDAIKELKFE